MAVSLGRTIRLGFLTDWIDPGYHRAVLQGAYDAARQHNASLVCFLGRMYGDEQGASLAPKSPVCDLISSDSVDGLIVMGGDIAAISSLDQQQFLAQFSALPQCVIAFDVPGASSVLVDNGAGIRNAIQHLMRVHGHKKFGFVRGIAGNPDAEERFAVFKATLAENALTLDERLVLPGDFTTPGGERAAKILLDERKVGLDEVDAVVVANDGMAFGFIEELDRRGIRVPSAIAVIGFDDVSEARYARVPVTTIRQPLEEQGKEAVRLIMAQLAGAATARSVLPTELVLRRTCGCYSTRRLATAQELAAPAHGFGFEAALVERRQLIIADLARSARGSLGTLGAGWEARLLNAFTAELKGHSVDAFRETIDDMLRRLVDTRGDVTMFHEVVSGLWRALPACAANDAKARSGVEVMLDEARLAVADTAERVQAAARFRLDRWATTVAQTAAALCASFSLRRIAQVLEQNLMDLGITRLDLVLFEGEEPNRTTVRVLTCVSGRARIERTPIPLKDIPRSIVPEADARGAYLAPVAFETELLGFVGMELSGASGFVYEAVRQALSAAIKGMRLREQFGSALSVVPPLPGRRG